MGKSGDRIVSFLKSKFEEAGGSMPFESFMELALYDPDFGYYTHHIADVGGNRADFSTWATLGGLGQVIAEWVKREMRHHEWKSTNLIEIGAGDGSLAQGLLKGLGWKARRKINYHIVDVSGPLRQKQQEKLPRATWHESMNQALDRCDGNAIIFSNELVDAFPAKWLRWNGASWEEIYTSFSPQTGLSESFVESKIEPGFPAPKTGQRIEIHESYRDWLSSWSHQLTKGSVLTIDYGGDSLSSIYRGRLHGTMRGYYRQQRIEGGGVYRRFGQQDLTCDVNFSDLKNWGEMAGWKTVKLDSQAEFFEKSGSTKGYGTEAAEAFQVLHQRTP